MEIDMSTNVIKPLNELEGLNPIFDKNPKREIYMAVDFIAAKIPSWKAIQTRLKKKPKTSAPIKVNLEQVYDRKLGPGAYTVKNHDRAMTARFSSLPRFSNSEKIKILVHNIEKRSLWSVSRGREIYRQNLDTAGYSVSNKILKLKQNSENRDNVLNLARKTRENILKTEKHKKLEKLNDRDQKFEKWNAARFRIQAQKGWVVLMSCITVAKSISKIRITKRKLKWVFNINSTILYQASRAIGRFRLILKDIRRKHSLKYIEAMLMPIVREKIDSLFGERRNILINCIDRCLTKRLFKRMIMSWQKKYSKVKSGLKTIIIIYISRMEKLALVWNKIQSSYNSYSNKLILPEDYSKKILRKYFYSKIKSFYIEKQVYKRNLEKINHEFKNIALQRVLTLNKRKRVTKYNVEIGIFPVFRIYNKDEIIRLYLEEEQKYHVATEKKESLQSLSESGKELRSLQTIVRNGRTYKKS
ncbi:hypothetical protein SteCoe_9893 [Stentor coeruleus]|uniref:Uncharacterized protein n=1 Tax=Stentor coeruleus TaxID=5963 RepID=A0A1R2CGT0_9CILI|nr:hypothetical protein SteCoe_9893 [Stentor coeruleus]